MTVDRELLADAVSWVEWQETLPFEKREWWQGSWYLDLEEHRETYGYELNFTGIGEKAECGTAYCVAGYIAQKALADKEIDSIGERSVYRGRTFSQHIRNFAAAKLGITDVDADKLFWGDNSAADIRREAERIAGGPL